MEMVKLKNGSEEVNSLVVDTMLSLQQLANEGKPGMLALYDLAEVCKGKGYKPFGDNLKKLRDLSLLQPDGQPHDSIRNVVLSAVEGDGLHMHLGSPTADDFQNRVASSKKTERGRG